MLRTATEQPTIELRQLPKIMGLFRSRQQEYQPVRADADDDADRDDENVQEPSDAKTAVGAPFSWVEYGIFLLLGIAMLWAWSAILQSRL